MHHGSAQISRSVCRMIYATCFVLLAGITAWNAHAAADMALEDNLKAVFLYKFASYVDWPEGVFADLTSPITIAIIGADQIASELSRIVAGRTAQNRPIRVKRLSSIESITDAHILYIGGSESNLLAHLSRLTKPHPILVVTNSEGALTLGSMINFVLSERRLRFEIALDSTEENGLKLSSRLLAIAQKIQTGSP